MLKRMCGEEQSCGNQEGWPLIRQVSVVCFCLSLTQFLYCVMQRHLEGHYGDVYTCRFFPSGVVILSGGADTQLKIWSAETGQCAATLTGHTAGALLTDTCFVRIHYSRNAAFHYCG